MEQRIEGGRTVYGETVGVLMLDTRFPRLHGDIGNARSFPFPVRYQVVEAATTNEIVADADRARALLPAFVAGAQALERAGVGAIATGCGFLSVVQAELAAAVSVPVLTSSLFLIPLVRQMVGERPIGVITADARQLSEAHLRGCDVTDHRDVHIRGMEGASAFTSTFLGSGALDVGQVTEEVTEACAGLQREIPDLGALVFECTNLQPFATAAQSRTGLPVFGIYHAVQMLAQAARVPRFDGEL